ncbi:MAG: acyl-CoA desaturase [Proteobacteria bacterium]|nr:MAG: acyl-CoA desaturase [Pseudomonadota bacterium]
MFHLPLLDLPWWGIVLATLALTHITIISVTLYLHRHQAHRAVDLHAGLSHFFRFWLWLTTGMVTREWVAVHRKHHARVDTAEDPHSPQIHGIGRVLWRGVGLYRRAATDQATVVKYGTGAPDDAVERALYSRHPALGLATMLAIDLLLFGFTAGTLVWAVQMAWIPFWAAGVINGVGHWFGYRNYETRDASRNIAPWGIVIGGEELHNNHHAYASSARFSTRPFEIDIGWVYLRAFAALGLATIRRTIPSLDRVDAKRHCDLETVNAVVANRFQVMSDFFQQVVKRVYREELRALRGSPERGLVKRAVAALNRASATPDRRLADHVHDYLELCPRLRYVFTMKSLLQETWNSAQTSPETIMQRLEDWCVQAENSGIQVLDEFSQRLRAYRLATA